jgi:hypothetical protein
MGTDTNPARAINVVRRVEMMCDFIENPAIRTAVEQAVPVTMPRAPGALGFDIPLWVGLGIVGLWAALDAFAERAGLHGRCPTCGRSCIRARFHSAVQGNEDLSLAELEDLRHLYAHNYAGEADDVYFAYSKRHVFTRGAATTLTCGAQFDGWRVQLDLPHLRIYSRTVQSVLGRFQ